MSIRIEGGGGGLSEAAADLRYVNVTGTESMAGPLTIAAIAGVQALIDYRGGIATRLLTLREKYGEDTYQPASYRMLHVAVIESVLALLANGLILTYLG